MKKAIIITLITIITLAAGSWLTSAAFAHTNDNNILNATVNGEISVTPAPAEDIPNINFFGNYVGSIEGGDLFYVDAASVEADFSVDLYITNADNLVKSYRFMIFKVTVYMLDAEGQWQEFNMLNAPDTFITLDNARVTISLAGLANYKVAIESGSYKSFPHAADNDVAPQFYLNTSVA
jgi:hypothetical protein